MLSIASRAAGQAVVHAAARSGTTTKSPTTGTGLEIVSHPAPAAAAARPIQMPITAAKLILFDARERTCRCGCTDAPEDPVAPRGQQLGGYPADAGRCRTMHL